MGSTGRMLLAREARALREQGLTHREVAQRMGISRSYAAELAIDPTGERRDARHERARGVCADCGGPTAWPGGDGTPKRCDPCMRSLRRPDHGTNSRYSGGCRCDECRAAHAAAARDRYRRKQAVVS